MSRKRCYASSFLNSEEENNENYHHQYYAPGCYNAPQVSHQHNHVNSHHAQHLHHLHHQMENANYMQDYLTQWDISQADYVVDAYGMVCYMTDFEYPLHSPNEHTMATEICYHIADDAMPINDELDFETPCKRERLESDIYDNVDNIDEDNLHEYLSPHPTEDHTDEASAIIDKSKKEQREQEKNENTKKNYANDCHAENTSHNSSGYRAEQGYWVEEPSESDKPK